MWYLKFKDLVFLDLGKYICVVFNVYGLINYIYILWVVGKYLENKESKMLLDIG